MDAVTKAIDDSSMGAIQKTTLKAAIKQASDNPDALKAVLDQVKEALGL